MSKALLIFGIGKISEAVSFYFDRDSEYEIAAYVVDDAFYTTNTFLNKPVIKLSEIDKYAPINYSVFIAVGYQGINQLRMDKYLYLKNKGYTFATYVSPKIQSNFSIGENSIIMDDAILQPKIQIGKNVFVWGGAMIGHHAIIDDHCWLTGGCLIGGSVHLGAASFVGLGAIIGQEVHTGEKCMIGAGTMTIKNIADKTVLISPTTEPHRLNSDQFTRMSTCFRT